MSEENSKEYLTVKQVCDLTMATPDQLRYWDANGLLVPERSGDDVANNRKLYTQEDVQKIREILLYKHLGFKLCEIKELFKAPKERRETLAAERNMELKEEFKQLSKKINFSSVMGVIEQDELINEAEMLGSYDLLDDEYEQNENLKMMARWMLSHSEKDKQAFSEELQESVEQFKQLADDAEWNAVEIQIAKFCDMWSKRFGWPTLGQMYLLSKTFQEIDAQSEDVGSIFNESDLKFISDMFYLAWISASLELLDEIIVSFYFKWMEIESDSRGDFDALAIASVEDMGELLCAYFGEIGNNSYLFSKANRSRKDQRDRINDASSKLLRVLEDAALDEKVEEYLDLGAFAGVNGESFRLANDVISAFIGSDTKEWLDGGGKDEIERCISEWMDALQVLFEKEQRLDEGTCRDEGVDLTEEDRISRFSDWVEDYYGHVLDDPPEAHWGTEEESCATERRCRELF